MLLGYLKKIQWWYHIAKYNKTIWIEWVCYPRSKTTTNNMWMDDIRYTINVSNSYNCFCVYCFRDFFNQFVIQIIRNMITVLFVQYIYCISQLNTTPTIHSISLYQLYYNLQANFCMQNMYHFLQSKLRCMQQFDINLTSKICMQTITIGCMQHFDDMSCTTRHSLVDIQKDNYYNPIHLHHHILDNHNLHHLHHQY